MFVTDREMSLVNEIEEEFIPKDIDNGNDIDHIDTAIENTHQNSVHLLCMWHINKNISARHKNFIEESWEPFVKMGTL